jgi:hypothetical protein
MKLMQSAIQRLIAHAGLNIDHILQIIDCTKSMNQICSRMTITKINATRYQTHLTTRPLQESALLQTVHTFAMAKINS